MSGLARKFADAAMRAWPGITILAITGFWFSLWAVLVPSPAFLGDGARQSALVKPRDVTYIPSVANCVRCFGA